MRLHLIFHFSFLFLCYGISGSNVRIAAPGTRISLMGIGVTSSSRDRKRFHSGVASYDTNQQRIAEERRRQWERRQEEIYRENERRMLHQLEADRRLKEIEEQHRMAGSVTSSESKAVHRESQAQTGKGSNAAVYVVSSGGRSDQNQGSGGAAVEEGRISSSGETGGTDKPIALTVVSPNVEGGGQQQGSSGSGIRVTEVGVNQGKAGQNEVVYVSHGNQQGSGRQVTVEEEQHRSVDLVVGSREQGQSSRLTTSSTGVGSGSSNQKNDQTHVTASQHQHRHGHGPEDGGNAAGRETEGSSRKSGSSVAEERIGPPVIVGKESASNTENTQAGSQTGGVSGSSGSKTGQGETEAGLGDGGKSETEVSYEREGKKSTTVVAIDKSKEGKGGSSKSSGTTESESVKHVGVNEAAKQPSTTTAVVPPPPIHDYIRSQAQNSNGMFDKKEWNHESNAREATFDSVWHKMKYGFRGRRAKPKGFDEDKTHLERTWDKMKGVGRPEQYYSLGQTRWSEYLNGHQNAISSFPKKPQTIERMVSAFHGAEPQSHPGGQHRKRTLRDGESRVYFTDQNRYYWYGTKDYWKDTHRNAVETEIKTDEEVLTCQFHIADFTDDPVSLPRYEDGKRITHVVFNCNKRFEKCCGLNCCSIYAASSGTGRHSTYSMTLTSLLILCLYMHRIFV